MESCRVSKDNFPANKGQTVSPSRPFRNQLPTNPKICKLLNCAHIIIWCLCCFFCMLSFILIYFKELFAIPESALVKMWYFIIANILLSSLKNLEQITWTFLLIDQYYTFTHPFLRPQKAIWIQYCHGSLTLVSSGICFHEYKVVMWGDAFVFLMVAKLENRNVRLVLKKSPKVTHPNLIWGVIYE